MPTATPVLTDLLDGLVSRLGDIANELRSNLSDPALAEVRNAARATERAYVLMSPWVPHADASDRADILGFFAAADHGIAVIEATALEGADNYVRVTMPGCIYLLKGEADTEGASNWTVEGRYPQ